MICFHPFFYLYDAGYKGIVKVSDIIAFYVRIFKELRRIFYSRKDKEGDNIMVH